MNAETPAVQMSPDETPEKGKGTSETTTAPIDCKPEFARFNPRTDTPTTPEEVEAQKKARAVGEAMPSRMAGHVCSGSKGGGVLLHMARKPNGTTSAAFTGGTIEDCEVLECVIKRAEEVAVEEELLDGTTASFGVFVEEDGRVGEWLGDHRVPTRTEPYCGVRPGNGRLPAEHIRSTVRSSFDSLRKCYEDLGLKKDPKMKGLIKVRFVIGRDGTVTHAGSGEYTFPECSVGVCILEEFSKLKFDKPAGGIVTVTYPIKFSPE